MANFAAVGIQREREARFRQRLERDGGLSEYDFTSYFATIATLRQANGPGEQQAWLDALEAWGLELRAGLT